MHWLSFGQLPLNANIDTLALLFGPYFENSEKITGQWVGWDVITGHLPNLCK